VCASVKVVDFVLMFLSFILDIMLSSFSIPKIRVPYSSDCVLALSDPALLGDDTPTLAHVGANFLQRYWQDPAQRSLWAAYLDTLPTRIVDSTPDLWSTEEQDLLEFPRMVTSSRQRLMELQQLWESLNNNANGTPSFTLQDLQWATWLVSSRSLPLTLTPPKSTTTTTTDNDNDTSIVDDTGVQYDERGQVIVAAAQERKSIRILVPLLDMVNHAPEPNAKLVIVDPHKDQSWFVLEALRPIPAGKEITTSYGVASSIELLLNYGFVPASNSLDGYMLKKGGSDAIASVDGWTTTLQEDCNMLSMLQQQQSTDSISAEDATLKKILQFRIRLKESYAK
jgi:hypothetical protein